MMMLLLMFVRCLVETAGIQRLRPVEIVIVKTTLSGILKSELILSTMLLPLLVFLLIMMQMMMLRMFLLLVLLLMLLILKQVP